MDFRSPSADSVDETRPAYRWYGRPMTANAHDGSTSDVNLALPWVVRRWWLWAILALVAGGFTIAAADGFPIVDLELAWTVEHADDVTRGADVDTIRSAIFWDFVFIFFYALALSAGALWARRQFRSSVGIAVGTVVAVGGVVAGLLDVVENLSMLGYLNGWGDWGGWITLAGVMAVPKFLLALAGVLYVISGIALFLVHTRGR